MCDARPAEQAESPLLADAAVGYNASIVSQEGRQARLLRRAQFMRACVHNELGESRRERLRGWPCPMESKRNSAPRGD